MVISTRVRDKKSLTSSMAVLPEYLRNKASEGGATDFKGIVLNIAIVH